MNADVQAIRPDRRVLSVLLTGTFIAVLDFFIVNVAIPQMQHDLNASDAQIQFVVAGFALAYGSMLIVGGRLGDIFGRRRIFVLGLALFTVASAMCGAAPDAGYIIAGRVGQGLAAALLSPQVLSILGSIYVGEAKAKALNAYGVTMGLASVFGQVVGGLLIHFDLFGWGWRTCFLINLPIGLAAIVSASRIVPESRAPTRPQLDIAGMILVSLALLATTLPLIEGRQQGWPTWTWYCLGLAAVLFVLFVMHERRLCARGGFPLIDPRLYRQRAFSVGLLAQLTFYMGMAGFYLVFALYLQEGRGFDALDSGLVFAANGAGYMVSSNAARVTTDRLGRQVLALAGTLRAAGLGLMLLTVVHFCDRSVLWLVPPLFINGFGTGFAVAPLASTVLSRMTAQHAGAAAGALTTGIQVGNAVGVSIIGVLFYGVLAAPGARAYGSAFALSLAYLVAISLLFAILVQLLPRRSEQPAA